MITSGGGFSNRNPRPYWQHEAVSTYFDTVAEVPAAGYNPNGRGYPDVSALAAYYQTVIGGEMYNLFGTSASATVVASMLSVVNSFRREQNATSLGFINPALYTLGSN